MHPGHWSPGRGDLGGEEEGGRPLAPVLLFTFPALLTIMSLKVSLLGGGGGGGQGPPSLKLSLSVYILSHFSTIKEKYARLKSTFALTNHPLVTFSTHILETKGINI